MEIKNPNYEIAEVFYRLNIGAPIEESLLSRAFWLILTNPNVKSRDSQLGSFLTGIMVKNPSVKEVVSLIKTALNIDGLVRYKPILPNNEKLVSVAGSGKKGYKTFNISTLSCLVASAAGAYIAKPGSSSTSSVSGSKDFMNMVGVNLLDPNDMLEVLIVTKFGFFDIESLVPKFDSVYGGKTFGPTPLSFAFPAIINPIVCDSLFYGLSHPNISLALDVFVELGYKDIMVVSSSYDNIHYIDEFSTLEHNYIGKIKCKEKRSIKKFSSFSLTQHLSSNPEKLKSEKSIIENIHLSLKILQGKFPGDCEDTVALNSAGILMMAEKVTSLSEGFNFAIETIRSGAGFKKLEEFIDATKGSLKALKSIIGGI